MADVGKALFDRFGKSFPTGTTLFQEGDAGHHMYVIQSGRIQLTRKMRGKDTQLAILTAGEFFGEMAIVNRHPRTATATVIEDAELLVIDGRTFEAMIRGNAEIALRFIKKLAARLAQANNQVEVLLLADLNQRVAHYLRQLGVVRGTAEGPGIRVDVAIEEIAEALGANAAQVQACLKKLEQAHLIIAELGGIVIAEQGKLDEFLQFLQLRERFGGG